MTGRCDQSKTYYFDDGLVTICLNYSLVEIRVEIRTMGKLQCVEQGFSDTIKDREHCVQVYNDFNENRALNVLGDFQRVIQGIHT